MNTVGTDLIGRMIQDLHSKKGEDRVDLNGDSVPLASLIDTSKESLEHLIEALVNLDYEIQKLESLGLRMEIRRVTSWQGLVRRLAYDLAEYRERIGSRAPEMMEEAGGKE